MKKIIATITVLILLMALSSCNLISSVFEAEPEFNVILLDDNTYEITSIKGNGNYRNIVIPEQIDGIDISSIGDNAFASLSSLESVTLPLGVKRIGFGAFSSCTSLSAVNLNEGLLSIGGNAFANCTSLSSIELPDSLRSIGSDAFMGCHNLIDIPAGTSAINYVDGWLINTHLTSGNIEICEGTVGIADFAFFNEEITSVKMPDSLKYIGMNAFDGATNLKKIYFGKGIEYIGYDAFSTCSNLHEVHISDGTPWYSVKIEDGGTPFAFAEDVYYGNSLFEEVIIPDGVSEIASNAFNRLYTLRKVTIPESVTKIGKGAFEFTPNLNTVYISNIESWCKIDFENEHSNPLGDNLLYIDGESVHSIEIPDGITEIKPYTFNNMTSLVSIELPDSVTRIGDYAFTNCSNLTVCAFKNVTYIGDGAFSGAGFEKIDIPDCVEYIGAYAFNYCVNAKELIIGLGVKYIGEYAFANMSSIERLSFDDKDGWSVTDNPEVSTESVVDIDKEGVLLVLPQYIYAGGYDNNPYYGLIWIKN